jgi:hypothetical protein
MYYFEKDYIMRLIHGIARILARMFFNRELEQGELALSLRQTVRESDDYLRKLVYEGKINEAEDRLFELIDSSGWETKELGSLILLFYDYVNSKDDAFLARARFSRDEIISGMEDAMRRIGMEIPEYLRI